MKAKSPTQLSRGATIVIDQFGVVSRVPTSTPNQLATPGERLRYVAKNKDSR